MIPMRIEGTTRKLGAPGDLPNCVSLCIRDEIVDGVHMMASAWSVTPEELERLNNGANIVLWVVGRSHPPVQIMVGT